MAKQHIQVKGNPQYARPIKPNAILQCPITGLTALSLFPVCAHFKGGPIYLREGKHYGAHRGHGFQHIWKEHHAAQTDRARAEIMIFAFIRAVLVTGTNIHHEGSPVDRASVSVRTSAGLVIVQENLDQTNAAVYHVITAFSGQPHGKLIGRL
jgi:hypothetical protein